MKSITLFVSMLISCLSFAEMRTINCEMPTPIYVHKADIYAQAYLEEDQKITFYGHFKLKMAGNSSDESLHYAALEGNYKVIPAGQMAVNEVMHISLLNKNKEEYIQHANILIDHPTPMASFFRTNDGVTYRANCSLNRIPR